MMHIPKEIRNQIGVAKRNYLTLIGPGSKREVSCKPDTGWVYVEQQENRENNKISTDRFREGEFSEECLTC